MIQPAPIPQTDPRAAYLAQKTEIDAAIMQVLESGQYILGRAVEQFEREFAANLGLAHGIGCASGTDALELALRACGIGEGHLVFTVSHTAVASVAAIERAGAKPVLVDIEPGGFAMDPAALDAALRDAPPGRPAAILPVHLYGEPADRATAAPRRYQPCLSSIRDPRQGSRPAARTFACKLYRHRHSLSHARASAPSLPQPCCAGPDRAAQQREGGRRDPVAADLSAARGRRSRSRHRGDTQVLRLRGGGEISFVSADGSSGYRRRSARSRRAAASRTARSTSDVR